MAQGDKVQSPKIPLIAPETEQIHFRVSAELKRDFAAAAADDGLNPSAAIKRLMREYVKAWKKDTGQQ